MTAARNADGTASLTGGRPLRGRVRLPGDKSISHRALLFSALADGQSTIRGLAGGDDVASTRAVLGSLGVVVDGDTTLAVHGRGVEGLREPDDALDCGNSGSTMRMLSGLLAGRPFLSVLTGDPSLRTRPMARIVAPLRTMGAAVDAAGDGAHAPVVIRGGALRGCDHTLTVASAQVKTALILAGLQADGTTMVTEPAPSRDHSERMLAALGAPVETDGDTVRVRAGAPQPFDLDVPGDPSSAAFWCVAAAITPGSELVLEDVALNPTRIAFVDVLRRMGAAIDVEARSERLGEPIGTISVRAGSLHATDIGGAEVPLVQDEIPVLAVAAAFAEGRTVITDASELRVKESDRIATVAAVLAELGVGVETTADGLAVQGGTPHAGRFSSSGDHRIALAAAVAASAVDGTSTIEGWDAVAVSYPEFLDHLSLLTAAP